MAPTGIFVTVISALALGALFVSRKVKAAEPAQHNPLPTKTPRGIRNNNPMNLEYNPQIHWNGQTGHDSAGYAQFDNAQDGIRAGMIDIHTGFVRDGEKTIRAIISEWAPPPENPTANYIAYVANQLQVSADAPLDYKTSIIPLAKAIVQFENNENPYPDSLYEAALNATGTL